MLSKVIGAILIIYVISHNFINTCILSLNVYFAFYLHPQCSNLIFAFLQREAVYVIIKLTPSIFNYADGKEMAGLNFCRRLIFFYFSSLWAGSFCAPLVRRLHFSVLRRVFILVAALVAETRT